MPSAEDSRSVVLRHSQKYFAQRAFYYDLIAQRQRSDPETEKQLNFLEQAFKRASRPVNNVLDIACGGGRHVVGLAQRGYNCTGYDLTPEQVDSAKARAKRAGVSVDLRREDATRVRSPRKFDAILALYILFLLPNDDDVKRCLNSMHSMLLPGGVLLCNIFNPFSARNIEIMKLGISVEETKAPGMTDISIMRLPKFDRLRGVLWINTTEVIRAPDGLHLFRSNEERARLFTHAEISNLLDATGFREVTAYADWESKPKKNPKADEIVFVARK